MKKCKSCQTEIDIKAIKCPHCQTDQRNWFAKHPILTVILVIIVIGIISPKSGKKETTTSNKGVIVATNTPVPEQPKEVNPKVGDVVKLGDREFTVNSVRRSKAFGYNTPKAGKEYIIVNVTIRNLGKDEVSYNPYDFKMQDANGAQESYDWVSLDDNLSSGTLAPGGKITGSIPFEIPIGDEAILIFQPSFLDSQRVVVNLGNK